MDKKKEHYYICRKCGELSTLTKQIDDCGQGGVGLCGCCYMDWVWNEKHDGIDVFFPKEYPSWTEISKRWYGTLKSRTNHVLRLRMLSVIPKEKLL